MSMTDTATTTTTTRAYACTAVDLTTGRVVETMTVHGQGEEHAVRMLLNLARQRGFAAPQLGHTGRVVYPTGPNGNLCWVLPKREGLAYKISP